MLWSELIKTIIAWIKELIMTQISRPQQGRQTTYPDAGGYTANQWARIFRLLARDYTTMGVFASYLDGMAVTNPAGVTIRVASGAALVNGHYCFNEHLVTPAVASNVDFTPSTPGAARIDKVVLVQNNTDNVYDTNLEFPTVLTDYAGLSSVPAHSCRLAILTGIEGGAARSLIQNVAVDGDIWMIELARYTISVVPAVSGLTAADNLDIDYRTRSFFIPVEQPALAELAYFPTIWAAQCADAAVTEVTGKGQIPADFVSDLEVSIAYFASSGVAGDVNVYSKIYHGAYGDAVAASDALGPSDIAVIVGDLWPNLMLEVPLTTPTAGDMIACYFYRNGNAGGDDYVGELDIAGWYGTYRADS